MDDSEYPALYRSANEASNGKQRLYLTLVKLEYGLLLSASILLLEPLNSQPFITFLAFIFVGLLIVLIFRALLKPEQDWYRCRALAESVKTLTWRYMMKAAPYGGEDETAREEFRTHLSQMIEANKTTVEKLIPDWSAADQLPIKMDSMRRLALSARKARYTANRVQNQRSWYAKKAKTNRSQANRWLWISGLAYGIALAMVIGRVALKTWSFWPIEPIIVLASSIIGWMQIKKFNELAAAYTVTAHEIGLVQAKLDVANTEGDFQREVNEAEQAFSREHTLWIARQTT